MEQDKRPINEILAIIELNIEYMKNEIIKLVDKVDKDYVTKTEFNPVRNIVYGMVGVILVAVLGALLKFIL
jgi:hypothetical protein